MRWVKCWKCPYCNTENILGDNDQQGTVILTGYKGQNDLRELETYNKENKRLVLGVRCVVCLNSECRKYTIDAGIFFRKF